MRIVTLNNGVAIPIVGYGVFQIEDARECSGQLFPGTLLRVFS